MDFPFFDSDDDNQRIAKRRKVTSTFIIPVMVATMMQYHMNEVLYGKQSRLRPSMIIRERSSMQQIKAQLGDHYFRRAYRMCLEKFEELVELLEPYLPKKRGTGPNGKISTELEVSAAIRYFTGTSMYDMIITHGMSHSTLFECVWRVVSAINNCPELKIQFPESHEEQKLVGLQFQTRSAAKFKNCVGCIDGLLICTEKPMESELEITKCGSKSFYCGRKSKFGLNMQGVCNAEGKFLAVWIIHPAASSDYISLLRSTFYHKIAAPGYLAPDCVIFGDNAYVSSDFMVTPYKNVRAGPKDDFNFYHSQVRITIERAFGMMVRRWGILRFPLASKMGVIKQIALTMALCSLHNFCTKETIVIENNNIIFDAVTNNNGNIFDETPVAIDPETGIPNELLDGGEHFDDIYDMEIMEMQKSKIRFTMRQQVEKQGLHRPVVSQQRNGTSA
jgi:DDE superfamily endonuclease